jgi:outer membrane protease
MYRFQFLLILIILFAVAIPLRAEVSGEIDASLILLNGFTKYQIGGDCTVNNNSGSVRFPISELEFPLTSEYASVKGALEIKNFIRIEGSFNKNLAADTGKMKDSDWGYLYYNYHSELPQTSPDSLDIYSESVAKLDATIWDINIGYRIVDKPKFTMLVALGFMQQYFDFTVSDLDQWYPSYFSYFGNTSAGKKYDVYPYHQFKSGRVLEYNVTYNIPYIKVNFGFKPIKQLVISSDLGFSPFVSAKDYDNHVLRDKISKGDCTGMFLKTNIDIKYFFTKYLYAGNQLNYLYIYTTGEQSQTEPGYSSKIEQEISSAQLSLSIYAGLHF